MIYKIREGIFTGAYIDLRTRANDFRDEQIVDVRDLVDRAGNDLSEILAYASEAEAKLREHGDVIITCDMGISRSRVVAIALLALQGEPIEVAIDLVLERCGNPPINPDLLQQVRQYFSGAIVREPQGRSHLVIGSRGFVGSNLCEYMKSRGDLVHGLHRGNHDLDNLVETIRVFEQSSASDVFYAVNQRSFHSHLVLAKGFGPLKNVLEACRHTGKRLVYVSSMVVFAGNARESAQNDYFASEDLEPFPYGNYSEMKYFSETLIKAYSRNYDLQYLILRPSGLYGPRMRREWILMRFIRKALAGENITTHEYANGRPCFEFLHISDFLRCVVLAQENPGAANRTLNIGSGHAVSTFELASRIVAHTGSSSTLAVKAIRGDIHNVLTTPGFIQSRGWRPAIDFDNGLEGCIAEASGDEIVI